MIEDAIQLLLVSNQLEKKVLNENTVLIYPNNPAKQRDYQDLVMRSFYLANADVKQTLNMIRTLVKTRDIFIDEKLNLLIMRDTPEGIRLAEKLIASQDLAEPEVMLEVEILEVKRSRLTELGIQYPNKFTVLSPINPTRVASSQLTWAVTVRKRGAKNQIGRIANPVLNLRAEDSRFQSAGKPPHPRQKSRQGQDSYRRQGAGDHQHQHFNRFCGGIRQLSRCWTQAGCRAQYSSG